MSIHITASGATGIGFADAVQITNNIALTGTVTVSTTASAVDGGTAQTIGITTNPTVGQTWVYRGLRGQGTVNINPSATCDITVQKLGPGMPGL